MKLKLFTLLLIPLSCLFVAIPDGYKLETITLPKGAVSLLGVCQKDADTMAICTWEGEVWEYTKGTWTLFAENLMEPNGIYYDKKDKSYYVSQKPELTRLADTNNDGKADVYETYCAEFGITRGYHEYHFGPVADSLGRKYASLNLSATKIDGKGLEVRDGRPGKGGVMCYTAPYRGWVYRSDRQGHFHPIASGFRSPCGIGMSPKDELFVTDNQGDWLPDCALFHVQEGKFYGHPGSLLARPDFDEKKILSMKAADFEKIRTRPAIWLPRTHISNSPGSPVWDTTKGKFGFFKDQLFIGDQSRSNLIRCGLEKVDGDYQGFCIQFLDGTQSGTVKMNFDDQGQLWTAQVGRGWRSKGGKRTALQKVSWDGKTVPFEIYKVNLTQDGFRITFTQPISKKSLPKVSSWHYNYWAIYGSDRLDQKNLKITSSTLSKDGKVLDIKVPLETKKVYELNFPEMSSATGAKLLNRSAFYTLNKRLPKKITKRRARPLIPGSGWERNDGRRPLPPVKTPKSFAETQAAIPSEAIILDQSQWSNPNWQTDKPGLWKRGKGNFDTKQAFGTSRIHLEFMTEKAADPNTKGQLYGNSGIFLMSGYELQVMNSYQNDTNADGMCGAIWGQQPPLVNASRAPGQWQSYDILMKAPLFSADGEVLEPMRATIFHNGELIQNDTYFLGEVNKPYKAHGKRPLRIQDHKGSNVFFRNMWIVPDVDYDKSLDGFRYSFQSIPKRKAPAKPISVISRGMVGRIDTNSDEIIKEKDFIAFWTPMFDHDDKDKNNSLSPAEFPHPQAFKGGDTNKDNKLSRAEHKAIYSGQFHDLDKNKDGQIDHKDH